MHKLFVSVVLLTMFLLCFAAFKNNDNPYKNATDDFIIDTLAKGLTVPWAMVFIDKNTMLFNERNGKVRMLRNDKLVAKPLLNISQIDTTKKMGLLGICIHPSFNKNKWVYIAYNYNKDKLAKLKVVRYRFSTDTLVDPFVIIDNINGNVNHSGCRLKFGLDSKLYITTGDADRPILAQDLKSLNGKILRVNDDGSVPADNPFVKNDTARKEIWTYGHRNSQGIAFQLSTGQLFNSEHGPSGGDEVNIIKKGLNYGWPIIHHDQKKDSMVSPLIEMTPSVGPAEAIFYDGDAFKDLKGSLLVAFLRGESIMCVQLEKNEVVHQKKILQNSYGRIRALAVNEEGFIYFSTSQNDPPEGKPKEGYDMILRMRPLKNGKNIYDKVDINNAIKKTATKITDENTYSDLCSSCHGKNLEGTERVKTMLDSKWKYGGEKQQIMKSIRNGIIEKGMPAWEGTLTEKEIENLSAFIILRNGREINKK